MGLYQGYCLAGSSPVGRVNSEKKQQLNLISGTYLLFSFHVDHPAEMQESAVVKATCESQMMTIPDEVVPLVNINAITLIGDDLI